MGLDRCDAFADIETSPDPEGRASGATGPRG